MPSNHALLVLSMAQIFVLRSSKDRDLVALLARAFAATEVGGVFEEFEAILKGPANAQRIVQDGFPRDRERYVT